MTIALRYNAAAQKPHFCMFSSYCDTVIKPILVSGLWQWEENVEIIVPVDEIVVSTSFGTCKTDSRLYTLLYTN